MKNTKVISGFPGVGKTVLSNKEGLVILDSDSSNFSWIEKGVRNPHFPLNYMRHIEANLGVADYIFVSSHDNVRKALEDREIEYTLVYPRMDLKEEYIERYRNRGNEAAFINFIDSKWDEFISNIEKETFPKLVELTNGEYLSDVLDTI